MGEKGVIFYPFEEEYQPIFIKNYQIDTNMHRSTYKFVFRAVCIIAVGFMIGYWLYKYGVEDRDIGVVDYLSLEHTKDLDFPLPTLCIKNPFLAERLNEIVVGMTGKEYLKYLNGEVWNNTYKNINYENTTINLNDYFTHATEKKTSDTTWRNSSLLFNHRVVFNGFYLTSFMKCFSIESNFTNHRDIKKLQFYYNIQELVNSSIGPRIPMFYKINYPGQYLLGDNNPYYVSMKEGDYRFLRLKLIEILRRRNTHNKKCSENSLPYDEMILKEHLKNTGCRPPYFMIGTETPACDSMKKLKESRFQYEIARAMDFPKDCRRMSGIRSGLAGGELKSLRNKWRIGLSYPEDVKVITQSKEIDVHSLIGNIGGYFGLFLGKHIAYI